MSRSKGKKRGRGKQKAAARRQRKTSSRDQRKKAAQRPTAAKPIEDRPLPPDIAAEIARLEQSAEQMELELARTDDPGRKLSARILRLARPEISDMDDSGSAESVVGLATLAWNISLLSEGRRAENIEDAARKLSQGDNGKYRCLLYCLSLLVEKKLSLFPDDDRAVLASEYTHNPHGGHLEVAGSGFLPEYDDPAAPDAPSLLPGLLDVVDEQIVPRPDV